MEQVLGMFLDPAKGWSKTHFLKDKTQIVGKMMGLSHKRRLIHPKGNRRITDILSIARMSRRQAMKTLKITLALAAAALITVGCGTKNVQTTEVPKAVPTAEPVKKVDTSQYTVVSHDTLWGIAGKSSIYSDNFMWPLIFKANRDSIKDPDLIYPKQDFMIQKGLDNAELDHAKQLASKTPKFVPHAKPRETLPLDYF